MLDSARLLRRLETPLNAHNLLNMRCVNRVLVKNIAVRKCQAMRAASGTQKQGNYEPKEGW